MKTRSDIAIELEAISPLLAGMEKCTVFSVPNGYFENLSGDIQASLHEEDDTVFASVNRPSASVPYGYFDGLAETLLNRIKEQEHFSAADELRSLSPLLYSIQGTRVFDAPEGYFEALPGTLMKQLAPQPARVISLRGRTSSFFRYAVAAAFTGVMALGVFKFTGIPANTELDPLVKQGTQIANENRFDEELAKVSDADIVKYLEANGNDMDAALVAKNIDENELPAQEDYLTDDKALDNYLNNNNLKDITN